MPTFLNCKTGQINKREQTPEEIQDANQRQLDNQQREVEEKEKKDKKTAAIERLKLSKNKDIQDLLEFLIS